MLPFSSVYGDRRDRDLAVNVQMPMTVCLSVLSGVLQPSLALIFNHVPINSDFYASSTTVFYSNKATQSLPCFPFPVANARRRKKRPQNNG